MVRSDDLTGCHMTVSITEIEKHIENHSRFNLSFDQPMEFRFIDETRESRRRVLFNMGLLSLIFYMSFLFNDYNYRSEDFDVTVVIKFCVVMPLALICLYLLKTKRIRKHQELMMALLITLTMLSSAVLMGLSKSHAVYIDLFALGLISMVGNILYQLRFQYAVLSSFINSVIMTYMLMTFPTPDQSTLFMIVMVFTAITVSSLIANYRVEKAERLSYLLSKRQNLSLLKKNAQYQEYRSLATKDHLTGVYNRRYFDELHSRVNQVVDKRFRTYGVIMLDIDHFKSFNDLYGHPAGDICLSRVGEALMSCVCGGDVVARYGGEEFVVVIPGFNLSQIAELAENIRSSIIALEIPHQGNKDKCFVTASFGVASHCEDYGEALEDAVKRADLALYEAKHAGRNQVQINCSPWDNVVNITEENRESRIKA